MVLDFSANLPYNDTNLATVDLDDCSLSNHHKSDRILFRPQAAFSGLTVASYPQALGAVTFLAAKQTTRLDKTDEPLRSALRGGMI